MPTIWDLFLTAATTVAGGEGGGEGQREVDMSGRSGPPRPHVHQELQQSTVQRGLLEKPHGRAMAINPPWQGSGDSNNEDDTGVKAKPTSALGCGCCSDMVAHGPSRITGHR